MKKENQNKIIGLLFIIIGAVAVMANFDLLPWNIEYYLFQWENILIIIGGFLILTDQNKQAGLVLLIVGVAFVLDDWFKVNISIWDLWPLVLVIAGVALIRRSTNKPDTEIPQFDHDSADTIEDVAVFSGADKIVNTKNFKGGSLTAVFGGSNVDMTMAGMDKESVAIDIFYMFGGSKIRVPKNWNVDVRVTNIFGGMSDKRIISESDSHSQNTLIIKGMVIFGGAEISN